MLWVRASRLDAEFEMEMPSGISGTDCGVVAPREDAGDLAWPFVLYDASSELESVECFLSRKLSIEARLKNEGAIFSTHR